jgi:branched-chain amino acid transport system ATP-binding protein
VSRRVVVVGAPSEPLLRAAGVHVHYGRSHVLHGVDLAVAAGESVGLLGRNGMGKTTTLAAILGLTPPSEGRIVLDGRDIAGWPAHRIARAGVALVPEGRRVFPTLTVRENLVMAARPAAAGDGARCAAVAPWALADVLTLFPRLAERLNHSGAQLSGGEQQMLAIGRALMTNPRLLLLDEATEGLAPAVRRDIWRVVRHIQASGVACVIVDKDLGTLLEVAHRFVILVKGRVVYEGSADHLAANPDIHLRHLGV